MSEKTIRPLFDKVVVQKTVQDVTPGGIVLPESAQKNGDRGTVVAVGPGKVDANGTFREVTEVCVGDTVLFAAYQGQRVIVDDKEYFIMSVDGILGVLE